MERQEDLNVDPIKLSIEFTLSNVRLDQEICTSFMYSNSAHNMDWNLTAYTKVKSPFGKYYLSFFIALAKFTKYPINADVSCFILNVEGKHCNEHSFTIEYPNTGGGNFYFVSYEDLFKNNLLIDNKLKILCKISVNSYIENKSVVIMKSCTNNLSRDFGVLMNDHSLTDVSLIVSGQEFKVHKVILSARSAVFAALFKHNMKENKENTVVIEDAEVDVFKEMLCFIYTGKVKNLEKLAFELLIISDRYGLQDLNELCESHMLMNLSTENVLDIYSLADKCNSEKLKTEAFNFITSNIKSIIDTPNFKSLDKTNPSLALEIIRALAIRNMV